MFLFLYFALEFFMVVFKIEGWWGKKHLFENQWTAHIKSIHISVQGVTQPNFELRYFEELKIWNGPENYTTIVYLPSPLRIRIEIEDQFVLLSSYFVPFCLISVVQYGFISDSVYHTIISKIHTEYCGVRPSYFLFLVIFVVRLFVPRFFVNFLISYHCHCYIVRFIIHHLLKFLWKVTMKCINCFEWHSIWYVFRTMYNSKISEWGRSFMIFYGLCQGLDVGQKILYALSL
jgi:hypothetical protein